jgi:hypothetical protein
MSFGIIHRFAGGTQEQYDNTLKVVHPDGGKKLPAGQTLHVAGPTSDGWVVVAIHDSQATWDTFRDQTLVPGLAKVENGFPGPPEETTFEPYHVQTA